MLPAKPFVQRQGDHRRVGGVDPWLILAAFALTGVGLIMVFSSSYYYSDNRFADPWLFIKKHLIALGVGIVAGVVVSKTPYDMLRKLSYPLLGALVFTLLLLPFLGINRGGATRWFDLGPLNVQPAEFAKLVIVLYLARSIVARRDKVSHFLSGVLPHALIVGGCAALIAMQPDLGTAAILVLVTGMMLYGGGARVSHLVSMALIFVPVASMAIVMEPYRLRRVYALWDPWAFRNDSGFQLVQSFLAFGNGGVDGTGLGDGQQKMFFLPEAHTDFIFALIGEELGMIGGLVVLVLFAFLGIRGFRVALRQTDSFAALLAFGVTSLILIEAFVNIAVVLGVLPTKGLALPFISYGGSALMATMLKVGILASLSRVTS